MFFASGDIFTLPLGGHRIMELRPFPLTGLTLRLRALKLNVFSAYFVAILWRDS